MKGIYMCSRLTTNAENEFWCFSMTERSHGLFSGRTRNLARHHKPGKLTIGKLLKDFKEGDRVTIVPKGNFKDIPHPRYRGRVGIVTEKRGGAYVVKFN